MTESFVNKQNLIRKHFQTWSGYLIITLKLQFWVRFVVRINIWKHKCVWKSLKRVCAFSWRRNFQKKKMVAKCLKFRTKAQVKEKKEENYKQRKKKNCPPQTSRSMGPSTQKQYLKLNHRVHQLCHTSASNQDLCRLLKATEERQSINTKIQVVKAELSRT